MLYQILVYTIPEKNEKVIQITKFNISAPVWNEKIQLHAGSDSVSDIQDYFEYIINKHETVIQESCIHLFQINNLASYSIFHLNILYF